MQEVIYKYPLPFKEMNRDTYEISINIPAGAKVISCLWVRGEIVVYAKHRPNILNTTVWTFKVIPTGENFDALEPSEARHMPLWKCLGSVCNPTTTLVFHVFMKN